MQSVLLTSTIALLLLSSAGRNAHAEDQDLRNRAIALLNKAQLASRMAGPTNIRTDVAFTATEKDKRQTTGSYTRTRSVHGDLRQDVAFGDFRASRIEQQANVATQGSWDDLPYPVRSLMVYVPYSPIRFDHTDVIGSIEPGAIAGQRATCIQFVTVRGEDHDPGEICVSDADGTVLAWHDSRRAWQALHNSLINGALMPSEFTYREGESFSLGATVTYTLLETEPVDALSAPTDWLHGTWCKTFQMPVPTLTPQPASSGSASAAVITVAVHAHVTAEGSVSGASVLKPVRPDLDAEALRLVSTWHYQPGTCEGRLQDYAIDMAVHFQGR